MSAKPARDSGETVIRTHFPVAIAGAGLTGLTLANLLGFYGVTCVLIGGARKPRGCETVLDDVLRKGFAFLVHSNPSRRRSGPLARRAWSRLAARVVVMRPDRGDEAVPDGVAAARVLGTPDALLARYSDHVFLLRPDRYVAACFAVDDRDRGNDAVKKMIAATFAIWCLPSPGLSRDPRLGGHGASLNEMAGTSPATTAETPARILLRRRGCLFPDCRVHPRHHLFRH